jgi:hypothetical protein
MEANSVGNATITAMLGPFGATASVQVAALGDAVELRISGDATVTYGYSPYQLYVSWRDANGFELPITGGYYLDSDGSACTVLANDQVATYTSQPGAAFITAYGEDGINSTPVSCWANGGFHSRVFTPKPRRPMRKSMDGTKTLTPKREVGSRR